MTAFALTLGFAPAPPPIVEAVREIEVECSVDVASAFTLRIGLSRTELGDWTPHHFGLFRPLLPVSVRVSAGRRAARGRPRRLRQRAARRATGRAGRGGPRGHRLDATLLMNLQEKVTAWPNLPDGAIATRSSGRNAIVPRVQPTSPVLVEPQGIYLQRGTTSVPAPARAAQRLRASAEPEPITVFDQGFFRPP